MTKRKTARHKRHYIQREYKKKKMDFLSKISKPDDKVQTKILKVKFKKKSSQKFNV